MDAPTLLATNALLSTAAAVVMAVVLRTRKTYPGFGCWTAGLACMALGTALLIPGVLPPAFASRLGRNALLIGGQVLILRGLLRFRGVRCSVGLELGVALVFGLPFAWLSVDAAQLDARIVWYCLCSALLSGATVFVALRHRPPHFGSNDKLLALWLALFALISLLRAAQALADVRTAFEAIQGMGGVYALAQILSVQLITLTLVSMNSQRIEWEHQQAAARLQDGERQLRSMGDNLPAGFIYRLELAQGRRRFIHVSSGILTTMGLPPAEVMRDAGPLFAMADAASMARYLVEEAYSAATLTDYHGTLCFHLPGGRVRWLDVRSRPSRIAEGITAWDGVAMDVTPQRHALQELHRHKLLVDSSGDAILTLSLQGVVLSWNAGAAGLFEHPAAQAVGSPVQAVLPPGLAGPVQQALGPLARGEAVPHFEALNLLRQGRRLDLSVAVSAVLGDEGQLIGAALIARDITDSVAARAQAQRQSRFYRCLSQCNAALARCDTPQALFDAVCQAIVDAAGVRLVWLSLCDAQGQLAVQAQAGAPAGDLSRLLLGMALAEAGAQGPAAEAVSSGEPVWCEPFASHPLTRAWQARWPDGGFQAAASLPVRRDGTVVGALTLCASDAQAFDAQTRHLLVDLAANISFALDNFDREAARTQAQQALASAHQQLEDTVARRTRQLAEASQRAEAASLAKSAFLANMSHEIRTPLNAMIGMAHLIRREPLSPQQTDRLGKLEAAAQHLLEVLNAVLDLSKIEAGKVVLDALPLRVEATVANVLSMLDDRAEAKQLRLLSVLERLPGDLVGDPTRLQQALLNYANNAVKFTDHGSVTLRVGVVQQDADSALLRFEVQDTGIGIEPAVMARLFGAFEQADPSPTRRAGGSGLGLAITRRLAELMGGEAGASSAPGHGSLFWFTARLARRPQLAPPAPLPAEAGDAEQALRQRHAGARVLLAEDNPVNAEVAQALLSDAGLVVEVAADGHDAVAMALSAPYRLVLMDMQMPRLDGLDASRAIRAVHAARSLPIIAMTANAFAEDRASCREAGMDDFISKPVDPAALYRLVLRWLDDPGGGAAPA